MPAVIAAPVGVRGAFPGVGATPYAIAQEGLAELVDAAVQARRIEAMQAAMRIDLINLAVDYAERCAAAFTSPSIASDQRHELARRAVVADLATALRVPERTMTRWVSEAWSLSTRLPATLAALRAGDLDEAHARVIIDETTGIDDHDVIARLDADLAIHAASVTAARLRRLARRLREQLQADTLADRHARALTARRVELEPAHDGMAWLHLHLPAPDALLIRDRIRRIATDAASGNTSGGTAGSHLDDPRTPDQVRADVARDLLLHGVPPIGEAFHVAAATIRPTVHVTVPVLTLLGTDDTPGELDGYGPIDPETARHLAAHAPTFTRLLTHPVAGTVLDVDRTSYRPPADLARWLRVRDQTCRFPGCNRHATGCDLDHTDDWAAGGRTAFDNLAHLCPNHHRLKHHTTWTVRHLEGGNLEWRSPTGRRHTTEPAVRIPTSAVPRDRPGRPDPSDPPDTSGPSGPPEPPDTSGPSEPPEPPGPSEPPDTSGPSGPSDPPDPSDPPGPETMAPQAPAS